MSVDFKESGPFRFWIRWQGIDHGEQYHVIDRKTGRVMRQYSTTARSLIHLYRKWAAPIFHRFALARSTASISPAWSVSLNPRRNASARCSHVSSGVRGTGLHPL